MDFTLSPRIQELATQVRGFLTSEVAPLEPRFALGSFRDLLSELSLKRQRVKELGLWAPQLPGKWGGAGLPFLQFTHIAEELGRSPLGHYVFNCQAPDAGNMELLHEFATPAQQERWLKPLARGEIRSCFAMTEPDSAGSNPVWLKTIALRDGSDYVLNGRKWFTSGADGAAFAVVMAVTDPDADPHRRASLFLVPTDTPGYQRVRNIPVMGHAGDDWDSHAEVALENCRVPRENLLGEEGTGFTLAQARLGPGRIHHCMRWIGVCERSFEILCHRAATRELAPGEKLGTRQIVQTWIAESRAEIDAARLLVLQAAWKIDRHGAREARTEVSVIKFFVAGVMGRVIDRALQACGALGVSDDAVLSTFYRNERAARIYDGPDEVHKIAVAKQVLKGYGLR